MHMEQVVQQNASLVEEATAATESMKAQASNLLQLLERFHLGGARATHVEPLHPRDPQAMHVQHEPAPVLAGERQARLMGA